MDGWCAEAIGAAIGGLFAALIAWAVSVVEGKRARDAVDRQLSQDRTLFEQQRADAEESYEDQRRAAHKEYLRQQSDAQNAYQQQLNDSRDAYRQQLEDQRRSLFEDKRLAAWADVAKRLFLLPGAAQEGRESVDETRLSIAEALTVWSVFLVDECGDLDVESDVQRCITRQLNIAWRVADNPEGKRDFRMIGSVERELLDGIQDNGRLWHGVDPEARARAAAWFSEQADPS